MTRLLSFLGGAVLLFAALILIANIRLVNAQEFEDQGTPTQQWIHRNFPACCSHKDCYQFSGRVDFDGKWYSFIWKGKLVRMHEADAKDSPDSFYHVCQMYYDPTPRCLFVPRAGS